MRPTRTLLLLLSFSIAAPVLRADVTVRYKTEVHAQQPPCRFARRHPARHDPADQGQQGLHQFRPGQFAHRFR